MGRVWIILVLFCLLNGALVEAQVPELSLLLRGVVIPENKVLDKEDVGTDEAGALSVVTPYSGDLSFHYSNRDQLVPDISGGFFWITSTETFSNGSQIIRLRRREESEQSTSQEGVWRCSVPSDVSGSLRSIYFGLYTRRFPDRGVLSISSAPALTAVSSLLTEPPTYTLTARTTGGPPGNVQWTIGGAAIPDSTTTANIDSDSTGDRLNARYTHTLMVRGRQSGVIRFTASNNRTSPAPSGQLTITFPDPPTNIQASQIGEERVQVTWTRPAGTINGFTFSVNSQSPTNLSSSTLSHTLTTLATGTHEISVVSLSTMNGHTLYSAQATDTVEVLALPTPVISSSTTALTSRSVRVQWTLTSGSGNKSPNEISITYSRTSCPPVGTGSVSVGGSLRTRDIVELFEFSTYTVRVTAVFQFGGSNPTVMKGSNGMDVQTLPAAPSGAPQGLSVQNVMATSVVLSWDEPACLLQNGDITGYMIRYVRGSETITDSSSGVSTTYTVRELIPVMEYSFSVAVVNSAGIGPFSGQSMTIRTLESTPGEVDSLTLAIKFKSINVSWSAPVRPNGIITKYEVSYTINAVTTVNTTDIATFTFTISDLEPGTNVNITVRAFTRIGPGEPITLINSTREAPPPVNNVQVEVIDGTSVRVTWEPLDIPEVTGYRVYYSLSESRKRQSGGFVEVEGRETNSAIVEGLRSGASYSFTVVGVVRLDGENPIVGVTAPGVTHEVVHPPPGTTGTGGSSCPTLDTTTLTPRCQYVGAVVGAVFATILLYTAILLIVLLVCFYWRKQQSTYSVQVKSEQQQREQPGQEGRVYDVIEPADKGIPMKQCAAYGDVHTRQRTGDPQDVGIYDSV